MTQSVDLALKPSARAHHVLFWLHILPLAALPAAMKSGPELMVVAAAVAVSWVWLRRHPAFGYGPRALQRIRWVPEGPWLGTTASGERVELDLLPQTCVNEWVIFLNFRDPSQRRFTRILLGDECSPEALRRLRAKLAQGVPPAKNPDEDP
ncbi:MAG: protein YgfX [Panacagrimonas sp.]